MGFSLQSRGVILIGGNYILSQNGIEKPFVLTEHTEYKWVDIDDIPSYEFVDSDLKIYPTVKEFLSSLK